MTALTSLGGDDIGIYGAVALVLLAVAFFLGFAHTPMGVGSLPRRVRIAAGLHRLIIVLSMEIGTALAWSILGITAETPCIAIGILIGLWPGIYCAGRIAARLLGSYEGPVSDGDVVVTGTTTRMPDRFGD